MELQTLTLDTIVGLRAIKAPARWVFDKTATIAWSALLQLQRDHRQPHKTLRDKRVLEGQIYVVANILSNAIGMAPPYWSGAAYDIVTEEARNGG
jgi:hypothetical protein